jgi:hypothetical protein
MGIAHAAAKGIEAAAPEAPEAATAAPCRMAHEASSSPCVSSAFDEALGRSAALELPMGLSAQDGSSFSTMLMMLVAAALTSPHNALS